MKELQHQLAVAQKDKETALKQCAKLTSMLQIKESLEVSTIYIGQFNKPYLVFLCQHYQFHNQAVDRYVIHMMLAVNDGVTSISSLNFIILF